MRSLGSGWRSLLGIAGLCLACDVSGGGDVLPALHDPSFLPPAQLEERLESALGAAGDHDVRPLASPSAGAADRYAEELVSGVDAHRDEIDAVLSDLAPAGWTLQRMATLDRTVLRVACFELSHRPDVPTGVVLAEAVELAETYGTDDSPRFVNGLLAAAARRLRPEAPDGVE